MRVITDGSGGYKHVYATTMEMNYFIFKVRAAESARIALSPVANNMHLYTYQVTLGSNGNTQINMRIRAHNDIRTVTVKQLDIFLPQYIQCTCTCNLIFLL